MILVATPAFTGTEAIPCSSWSRVLEQDNCASRREPPVSRPSDTKLQHNSIALSTPGATSTCPARLTWRAFLKTLTSDDVLVHFGEPKHKPDILIGVNDGIVPAAILAVNYDVPELHFLHIPAEFNGNGTRRQSLVPPGPINALVFHCEAQAKVSDLDGGAPGNIILMHQMLSPRPFQHLIWN